MALKKGTRVGHYEILTLVGAGGMGEVYRARDTLLGRQVAIKALPSRLAGNHERQRRLEREARAISTLSHPHICTLHDLVHHDATDFLVMEYLEGETLAARISRGALPAKELLRYATEIADALAAAHAGGVLHRDLKPSNIMLTKSGVKLLDFGLAKMPDPEDAASGGLAVTTTEDLTLPGVVLGTLPYIPPEQLEGKATDARSDIFSFGAVVYEMATGMKPFADDSPAGVTAAILKRDPPPISTVRSEYQPISRTGLDRPEVSGKRS